MTHYDMLRGLLALIIDPDMEILKTVEGPTPLSLAAKVEMQVQAAETVEAEPTPIPLPAALPQVGEGMGGCGVGGEEG